MLLNRNLVQHGCDGCDAVTERLDKGMGLVLNWGGSGVPQWEPCPETYEAKTT